MSQSLLIGSDDLGWQEFGDVAKLGVRTKAMPGGDGSLEFIIPGDAVWQRRNVIVPEARVILRTDGEADYAGYLVCDPLRHRLGAHETLELAAAGAWGLAGRDSRHSYLGADSSLDKWQRTSSVWSSTTGDFEVLEDAGKFTIMTDGRLRIRAEGGRAFDDYAKMRLSYFLDAGLSDAVLVGMDFAFKAYLPDAWEARIQTCAEPWSETRTIEWTREDTLSDWSAVQELDFTDPEPCVALMLFWNSSGSNTPTTAPHITLDVLGLYGRMKSGSVNRTLTVADILADCAADLGITTTRIVGLTDAVGSFVVPYPATIADIMAQAVGLAAAPIEVYVDCMPDGSLRLTACERPASVDVTRNRLWSVGGRAGEDLSGLVRDWEATPEQVEVIYAADDEAGFPDGSLRNVLYPAAAGSEFPLVESVDKSDSPPMTAALAAQYAQMFYTARQESLYSGEVLLGETALTSTGQEVPTVKLRPGDRLHIPSLLDCPAAGMYVQAVSYDFSTRRCTATVGEPWDPLGFRVRPLAPVATSAAGAGVLRGRTRRGLGYPVWRSL